MANKISVLIDVAVDGANRSLTSFRQKIGEAEGATGKFKVAASGAFDQLKANAGSLALAGGAALVGFGVKAIGAFQETALAAGQLRDSLGLTAEEASKYVETAGDLGISIEALEATMGRMNRTAADTPGAFEAIGAELVRNADGSLNVNETFLSTVDALNQMPDAAARASAAQKIFGRSWMDIAEMVGQGADGLRASLDSVEAGKIIDDEEVARARRYRDAMDELRGVAEELAVEVGGGLAPAFAEAAENASSMFRVLKNLGLVDLALKFQDVTSASGNLERVWGVATQQSDLFGRSVNKLTDAQFAQLKAAQDAGASEAELKELTDSFKQSTDDATAATQANTDATEDNTKADEAAALVAKDRADELDAMRQKIDAARQATEAATMATIEAGNSDLAYRNQVASTAATIAESNLIQMDASRTTAEHAQAARDAEGAVYDQAAAAVRLAEDQAAASGSALTAEQSAKIYRDELVRLASELNGPAAAAIQAYIDSLGRIPKSIYTNVGVTRNGDFGPMQGGRSHTGSRFEAGEAKAIIPGQQLFVPDGPGRMYSPAESQRMMGGSAPTVNVSITLDGQELRGMVRTEIADSNDSTVASLRSGLR